MALPPTPLRERQQANLRTVCKAVGKNGDTGERLYSYIIKLKEYRRDRQIGGDMWPLYPCVLSNFAIWLQLNSPKENATSVAPRCISTFVSAASSLKLPVFIDSPHLMAAYGEAMEWDTVPVHKLGRWKIHASPAAAVPAARRRGAGSGGPRTMPAVYCPLRPRAKTSLRFVRV